MKMTIFALVGILLFLSAQPARAVCPVCTVAVGAGLGISRMLGIDDAITGVWIGALVLSMSLWFSGWLKQKKENVPAPELIAIVLMSSLLFGTLFALKIIGIPGNTLWGIDKIALGIIIGAIVFYDSVVTDKIIKRLNQGKVIIYYQKVILPILFLSIASYILFVLTK